MRTAQYSMTCVAPTVSALLGLPSPAQASGSAIPEIVQGGLAERVAIVAPDALGEYAWGLWQAEMPFLRSLHARHSLALRSVMPSITPVNFAAMVTGTDRQGHGIGSFNDTFACETLFEVVRRAGGQSAGIGIKGYTGCQLLARNSDLGGCVEEHADAAVADKIMELAQASRPRFLIAQLGCVDDVFHAYGPSSPEVRPMLRETDAILRRLAAALTALGYAMLVLSDHGQHDIPDPTPGGKRGGHGSDSDLDCVVPCTWTRGE
jgi:predicted AlkP superfamily pyrophosphatase or phosphodiesterase